MSDQTVSSAGGYRPDIDGLRAIAVGSVVLFHAGLKWAPGGFVGVDVFFVISGYLITRLIRDEVGEQRFSYANFYLRRARRLFPALFVTLLATFVTGAYLFVPYHLSRMSSALLSALVWVSNVYFWSQSGYFDTNAIVKPLLHTWSLSVEEQFYLVWPTLLILTLRSSRRWVAPALIAIAGVASLALTEWLLDRDPGSAFYLAPSRVIEFAIGSLLVWVDSRRFGAWTLECLSLAGLGLIAYAVLVFDEDTRFPGFAALIPSLGAASVILGGQARCLGLVLRNRAAVGIGLISYSLYLVHWPVVVFYRYAVDTYRRWDKVTVVLLAFVLAGILYRWVETPWRRPHTARIPDRRRIRLAAAVCLLLVSAVVGARASGWPWRWDVPEPMLDLVGRFEEKRDATWALVRDHTLANPRSFPTDGRVRLLIVGDSHAIDVFNALYLNQRTYAGVSVRRLSLDDVCLYLFSGEPTSLDEPERKTCRTDAEEFRSSELLSDADYLLYSTRWQDAGISAMPHFIDYVRSHSRAEPIVFGRTAEFASVPDFALDYGHLEGLESAVSATRNVGLDALNDRLEALSAELQVAFVDKMAFMCDRDECDVVDDTGHLLLYDYGHWTLEGAAHYGRAMAEYLLPLLHS